MRTRSVIVELLVSGVLIPVVPRLVDAVPDGEGGRALTALWRELVERPHLWLWVLSPALVLALVAWLLLRRPLNRPVRRARLWGIWAAAIANLVFGMWACSPVEGQGYRFYIGEGMYPMFALPGLAIVYFGGRWIARRQERRAAPPA